MLAIMKPNRIAWMVLWPNARPFHMNNPQPTLRAIADVDSAAGAIATALKRQAGQATTAPLRNLPSRMSRSERDLQPEEIAMSPMGTATGILNPVTACFALAVAAVAIAAFAPATATARHRPRQHCGPGIRRLPDEAEGSVGVYERGPGKGRHFGFGEGGFVRATMRALAGTGFRPAGRRRCRSTWCARRTAR